jgi:hypothetical protein
MSTHAEVIREVLQELGDRMDRLESQLDVTGVDCVQADVHEALMDISIIHTAIVRLNQRVDSLWNEPQGYWPLVAIIFFGTLCACLLVTA